MILCCSEMVVRRTLYIAVFVVVSCANFAGSQKFDSDVRELKAKIESGLSQIGNLKDQAPDDEDEELVQRLRKLVSVISSDVGAANSSSNVSAACAQDITRLVNDWPDASYARQMVASFGSRLNLIRRFEYTYNPHSWGLFEVCREVRPTADRSFGGQYCLASGLGRFGVCFPDSCNSADVKNAIVEAGVGAPDEVRCAEDQPFRTGDIIAIVIFSILAGLMVLGTAYDVIWHWNLKRKIKRSEEIANMDTMKEELVKNKSKLDKIKKKRPGILGRILITFSVVSNGRKILSTNSGGSGTISSINGIRVISMMWIILGHVYSFPLELVDNARYLVDYVFERWSTLTVFGSIFAVDVFFLLSGFLVTYLALRHMRKTKGKMNWFLFYFHRWWRLTPALGLMLLLWSTLMLHLGDGPDYTRRPLYAQEQCRKYWWAVLLYFHNMYPWVGGVDICMGWLWYLFVDMQLYVISPFFIILLHKSAKLGTLAVASFTVASMATVAGLATYYGYPIGNTNPIFYNDNVAAGDDHIYTKPWSRLQAYLVGVYLGYVLCRLDGQKIKINKIFNLFLWCAAAATALAIVYGVWPTVITIGERPEQWVAVLYRSTTSFAFVTSVAWVIFACETGNGGPVHTFLSWSAWIPLSRLTYCTYLIHPIVIYIYYWSRKTPIHYTEMNMVYYFVASLVLSYACAFVVSLAIEAPMIGLEKILLRRRR
ncbi:nose resistant to fluoxetine protein 6-like [Ptychodera flava]|uniref:nose resistant to fluoxetine protein 6-like n=1 Tax=Ptychodera flava TaxID=63121 RepID=UPI003969BF34